MLICKARVRDGAGVGIQNCDRLTRTRLLGRSKRRGERSAERVREAGSPRQEVGVGVRVGIKDKKALR